MEQPRIRNLEIGLVKIPIVNQFDEFVRFVLSREATQPGRGVILKKTIDTILITIQN